ncbi:hypothetical protein CEP51_005313 [Fusarium floridanum]|uniref:Glycosyl transferase CAP10 domain-containing protein n=1 Tax=Fusarium floridanum TaxID=1325733 RepID=A0A428RXF5_9HYPO|nr:hypothetical protein CEP51_005313 [Fusarium floridanum]
MRASILKVADPLVALSAAALISSTLKEHLSSRRPELFSELLCWATLPVLIKHTQRTPPSKGAAPTPFGDLGAQTASSGLQWIVAAGIAGASFYRAECSSLAFFPALTPLLFVIRRHLGCKSPSVPASYSWDLSLINSGWGMALVASVAAFTLSKGDLLRSLLSSILVAALLIVYGAFTARPKDGPWNSPLVDIEASIIGVSIRVVALLVVGLGIQSVALGLLTSSISYALLLGLSKASSWFFMIQLARNTSWLMATTIGTFAIASTANPFRESSDMRALCHVVVSLLALCQTIQFIPGQLKGKSLLWGFFLISLLPYLSNVWAIQNAQAYSLNSSGTLPMHPVEALVRHATENFEHLLRNQSKGYEAASDEYRRRYHQEPPPGFEAWFRFAKSNQSPIIDEYDMIYDIVSPFWKLSGQEVLDVMAKVKETPRSEVWLCEFSGKEAKTKCQHPYRTFDRHYSLLFDTLLGDLPGELPDVKFLINHFDEPRVLIPSNPTEKDSPAPKQFSLTDMSLKSTWEKLSSVCAHSQRKTGSSYPEPALETFNMPFVKNHFSEKDLCQHPEYKNMHGFLMSPKTFQLVEGLVPILSTGAPSTMGDILFPSPAYIEEEFQYDVLTDLKWESKRNNLYWAGSTTGGFVLDDHWRQHQRQRFVALAQNLEQKPHSYLRQRNGMFGRVYSTFLNSRLFDVAFTRIFQCERQYCRDESTYFNTKSWANKDEAFRSRLVFDTDGNGISGRYYKLLASNSVPLKQTIFREWHDERLMPWVHYVPVSQSLEELPELVSYLTSTEAGQRIAKAIAEQGRDWFSRSLRQVDMTVYIYRLQLELARLQDPKRLAS